MSKTAFRTKFQKESVKCSKCVSHILQSQVSARNELNAAACSRNAFIMKFLQRDLRQRAAQCRVHLSQLTLDDSNTASNERLGSRELAKELARTAALRHESTTVQLELLKLRVKSASESQVRNTRHHTLLTIV